MEFLLLFVNRISFKCISLQNRQRHSALLACLRFSNQAVLDVVVHGLKGKERAVGY